MCVFDLIVDVIVPWWKELGNSNVQQMRVRC